MLERLHTPPFSGAAEWSGSEPLGPAPLHDHVVLVNFRLTASTGYNYDSRRSVVEINRSNTTPTPSVTLTGAGPSAPLPQSHASTALLVALSSHDLRSTAA